MLWDGDLIDPEELLEIARRPAGSWTRLGRHPLVTELVESACAADRRTPRGESLVIDVEPELPQDLVYEIGTRWSGCPCRSARASSRLLPS